MTNAARGRAGYHRRVAAAVYAQGARRWSLKEQPLSPRRVRVNMSDLVDAFDMGGDSIDVYLDLEAGEVIPITDDIRSEMSAIS